VQARRILVVDDNCDAAELLADTLRTAGHEVRTAFDGPDALKRCTNYAPEIALLDIGLPVMDGYELAQRLRELSQDRPLTLIALTGYGQETDRVRTREAGFHEHLVKPIDLERLDSILQGGRSEDGSPGEAASGG
jgi:CheY-like chemotaxis protein